MSSTQEDELSVTPYTSADNTEDSWVPKIKRRRRFSVDETRVLENEFKKNSSPNQEKIQRIANRISTPRKIVTTWFQNRRAKNKRKEKLKREEAIANTRREGGFGVENSKENSSSQAAHDEGTPEEEEVSGKSNDEEDSGSDYDDTNTTHDLDHHYSYQLVQQQSLMPMENFNPEIDLDNNAPMVSLPFQFANNNTSITNSNHPDIVNPSALQLPYEQHYNINIYNNMTNHFVSQEHVYDGLGEASFMRPNSHLMNYQHFLNMYYYQHHFSPYFIHNANLPSQSASSSGSNVNESICINPNDIFLNYFPQYRIQYQHQLQQQLQVREEDINENED